MRYGKFIDHWRGDGVFLTFGLVTLALRRRWHLYVVKPQGKPGYRRVYIGPLEIEMRTDQQRQGEGGE